jgi:hypothetical protein
MRGLRFSSGLVALVFSRRARRAVRGVGLLRRSHEHLVLMAVLEGSCAVPGPYYEAYLDALEILGARALLIAKTL